MNRVQELELALDAPINLLSGERRYYPDLASHDRRRAGMNEGDCYERY